MRIAVAMPVGPDPSEIDRCLDTIASIVAFEPAVESIVVVDDAPSPRRLDVNAPVEVTVLPHPLRDRKAARRDRVAAATLAGLGWIARHADADVAMKLDTDSLLIGPLAGKLERVLADETTGLVGSYDRTCNGTPRSFESWAGRVRQASRVVQPKRIAVTRQARRARRYVLEARARGYIWGEHVLACGLAIPRRTLDVLASDGTLDDPALFFNTWLSDDVVLGLLVRRAGFRLAGDVEEGGLFGVAWRGLPDTPERLLERGYSVIHSVKNDSGMSEREIRAFFAAHRAGLQPSPAPATSPLSPAG